MTSSADPIDCDMNNDEYAFEPAIFSDFTLHYGDASFHLHQNWLYVGSAYFRALLSTSKADDDACCLTSRCGRSHHRCVTLTGQQIGGVDISVTDLLSFLRQLYCEVDGSGSWRERCAEMDESDIDRQYKMPKYWYIAQSLEVDEVNDRVLYLYYGFDEMKQKQVRASSIILCGSTMQASKQRASTWIQNGQYHDPPHFHLAHYFECQTLMNKYEKMALEALKQASTVGLYTAMWRILRSADRYHWKEVRPRCIEACLKDRDCGARPSWQQIYQTLDPKSTAELFARAMKADNKPHQSA
jgi:hypothetical protein